METTLFSIRDVTRIFGLKENRLRYWDQTGFICPSARHRGKRVYAFSDLIEIRAARDLLAAGVPLQRVRKNLMALRRRLPEENHPVSKLSIGYDGDNITVTNRDTAFSPVSGQTLLNFRVDEIGRAAAEILKLTPATTSAELEQVNSAAEPLGDSAPHDAHSAYEWFLKGCGYDEAAQNSEAIAAYEEALKRDPHLAAAHTNLGNLYYRSENPAAAQRCYETALVLDPNQVEARYNLANIYEESDELDLAIAEYRRALQSVPDFADAHFNLAFALERVGALVQARSHWRSFLTLAPDCSDARPWRELAQQRLEHA